MSVYNPTSRYYIPTITVATIENWLCCSHRTAERRMAEMKRALGLKRFERVKQTDAEAYFGIKK